MTLAAAVCWAVYVAFGAGILRRHSPLRTSTWAVLAGSISVAPLALLQLAGWDAARMRPEAAGALVYSALLAVAAANVAYFGAVRILGPTRVAAFQFLLPPFTVALAALLLHEPIRLAQVVGGLVIIAGIVLMRGRPFACRRPASATAAFEGRARR